MPLAQSEGLLAALLGLVTTKLGALCLSPQCGISSTVPGKDIAMEAQRAKLQPARLSGQV